MISKVYDKYAKSIILFKQLYGCSKGKKMVHFSSRARSEEGITGGAGKKEERERQEERDKKTKGKEVRADKGTKLPKGRLIFRSEKRRHQRLLSRLTI